MQVGFSNGQVIEIKEGLSEGDEVYLKSKTSASQSELMDNSQKNGNFDPESMEGDFDSEKMDGEFPDFENGFPGNMDQMPDFNNMPDGFPGQMP